VENAVSKDAKTIAYYQWMGAFSLIFLYLVLGVSGWWLFSAPIYFLIAISIASGFAETKLKPHSTFRGIEAVTQIVTAGDEKKNCTLIICPDRLDVDMGVGFGEIFRMWEAEGKPGKLKEYHAAHKVSVSVPLADVTSLLFQQLTKLTGFGIDYTDKDGPARLMFVNMGEGQEKRTRKILKIIQDAFVAMAPDLKLDPPPILDISKALKAATESVVHRIEG